MAEVRLKSPRTEHQPLLSEGTLRFPQTDSFETHVDVEEREKLERSLLRKLDRRMSILILIYILNCKCLVHCNGFHQMYTSY